MRPLARVAWVRRRGERVLFLRPLHSADVWEDHEVRYTVRATFPLHRLLLVHDDVLVRKMRAALDAQRLTHPNVALRPLQRALVVLPGAQLLYAADNLQAFAEVGLVEHLESEIESVGCTAAGAFVLPGRPHLLEVLAAAQALTASTPALRGLGDLVDGLVLGLIHQLKSLIEKSSFERRVCRVEALKHVPFWADGRHPMKQRRALATWSGEDLLIALMLL